MQSPEPSPIHISCFLLAEYVAKLSMFVRWTSLGERLVSQYRTVVEIFADWKDSCTIRQPVYTVKPFGFSEMQQTKLDL